MKHPIDNIRWVEAEALKANDYNPNVVLNQELKLLEFSILQQGWIQPILITPDGTIIDGFHRATLGKSSAQIREKYGSKVPCVVMELTEAERKLLTIRINRAKGTHLAFKMAEIVKSLIEEHGMSPKAVGEAIGADKAEIDLLMQDDVFKKLDIQNHKYSKAWIPK
ncbi:putative ParB-like nuclease domain containing protein [Bacillus phage vB_BceS-M2]